MGALGLKLAVIWPYVQKYAPFLFKIALKLIGLRFNSKEEQLQLQREFIKEVQAHSANARSSKSLHDTYKKLLEEGLKARRERLLKEREKQNEKTSLD